jgi:hypothetical protein
MRRQSLRCPHCGWDGASPGVHGHAFRFLEEVTSMRTVIGTTSRAIRVDSDERIAVDDPGAAPRLLCGNCLEEFDIPEGMKIAFS